MLPSVLYSFKLFKMKKLFFLFALLAHSALMGQSNLVLKMDQNLGDIPFAFNQAVASEMGYYFNVTRLQYYVSEIVITHDGGQETPVTDLYLLIDPSTDNEFPLGSFDVNQVEKIQFSIGVDQAHNHLDPATYDSSHPLAPQNPSMHWGWASGYRFIALEGLAGNDANSLFNIYQIHTVDDANYYTLYLDVEGQTIGDEIFIHINADYTQLLKGMDVSSGVISHASTGPSRTIVTNLRDVFTAGTFTSVVAPDVSGIFNSYPNPANAQFTVNYDFTGYNALQMTIHDLTGKSIYTCTLDPNAQSKIIPIQWQAGLYVVQIKSQGKILAWDKLIVE